MHMTISASPTGDLDRKTIERFWAAVASAYRTHTWLDFEHHPQLVGCQKCHPGIVQLQKRHLGIAQRFPTGDSHEPVNGSSLTSVVQGSRERLWLCPACSFKNVAARARRRRLARTASTMTQAAA